MAHTLSDDIFNHLPSYLSPKQKDDLFEQIKKFPKINYYISKNDQEVLQGDAWTGFTILDFYSGEKRLLKGVVLSNSCDIDTENDRDLNVNVIFAPLIKMEKYVALLRSSGITADKIDAKIEAIKLQKVTSIMYFPKGGDIDADYIINLDDIRSQPLQVFLEGERLRLFTLSQSGFYVLLLKISIHFCRFQEGVLRYEE
jgi:hypothetical protein